MTTGPSTPNLRLNLDAPLTPFPLNPVSLPNFETYLTTPAAREAYARRTFALAGFKPVVFSLFHSVSYARALRSANVVAEDVPRCTRRLAQVFERAVQLDLIGLAVLGPTSDCLPSSPGSTSGPACTFQLSISGPSIDRLFVLPAFSTKTPAEINEALGFVAIAPEGEVNRTPWPNPFPWEK